MRRDAATTIVSLLACPECGDALRQTDEGLISACGKRYKIAEDVAYFAEVPGDFEDDGNGPNVPRIGWGAWRTHNFEYYAREFASVPDTATVLDLGAGPGQFAELTDRFATLVSMDFRAFAPVNVVADLTKPLPLRDASFDLVMASNVLEHIPDTKALLAEVRRVLKPGGRFVATIPFMMRVHQKPYDFNRYTNYQLAALLSDAGFSDPSVEGLSHPIEVYRNIERQYFAQEIGGASGVRKLLLRLFRFSARIRSALLGSLSSRAPSDDFTEGYGLSALVR